jgi:hypothetical protein
LAGADAHCLIELGAAVNEFSAAPPADEAAFREHLLRTPRLVVKERVSPLCRPYSQLIKSVKTKDPRLFLYQAKRLAVAFAREEIRWGDQREEH